MLTVSNLNAFYGKIQALHDVSLHVDEKEIVALIGANGAGKTTLLKSICGLIKEKSGDIAFCGGALMKEKADGIVRRGIAMVPEGRKIFSRLTVLENLEMGAYARRDGADAIKKDMDYVFHLFPVLKERHRQKGGTLSGGEQQMLAIARALMARPKLLMLDEPSMGLAPVLVEKIFQIIREINGDGMPILLVEQNANMALHTAHRGYVLEVGRMALEDAASKLLEDEQVRHAYLGK